MRKTVLISFFLFLFYFSQIKTGISETIKPDTSELEIITILTKMQPSLKSITNTGHQYTMYAVKVKQDWVFLIMDSLMIYSMRYDEHHTQLIESDKNFTDIICLSIRSQSLKKKNKILTIAETDIECYYRMQSKASKMYSSMKKMNKKAKTILANAKKGYGIYKKNKSKIRSIDRKFKTLSK